MPGGRDVRVRVPTIIASRCYALCNLPQALITALFLETFWGLRRGGESVPRYVILESQLNTSWLPATACCELTATTTAAHDSESRWWRSKLLPVVVVVGTALCHRAAACLLPPREAAPPPPSSRMMFVYSTATRTGTQPASLLCCTKQNLKMINEAL